MVWVCVGGVWVCMCVGGVCVYVCGWCVCVCVWVVCVFMCVGVYVGTCVGVCMCVGGVCVCVGVFFFIIYLQHAPLHYYAILHACFILYIYVVSITFIHLAVTVPFITYQSLLSL